MILCYYPPDKFYYGHDSDFHLRRINALIDSIRAGTFPIYIDHTAFLGYGYAIKWFYSDFILIPFAWLGVYTDAQFAYKAIIFSATIFCGIFTYIFVNKVYKNTFTASIASLLYTFSMYRLLDMSHRSTLSETIAFTFIPIVFLGLYEIIKGNYRKWYIISIGYSLLLFTHLLSTVLMFITMIIVLIIYYKPIWKEPKRLYYLLLAGVVACIISAYYFCPMFEQVFSNEFYLNKLAKTENVNYHRLRPNWLIWGLFSGILPSKPIFIPTIGMLLTLCIGLRLFVYEKSSKLSNTDIFVLLGLFYFLLSSKLFSWDAFPLNNFRFIQFPWRFFMFTSFFFAISGAYYLSLLIKSNKRYLISSLLIIVGISLTIINDSNDFKTAPLLKKFGKEPSYELNYNLGTLEYLPSKVPSKAYITKRGENTIIANDSNTIITNINKIEGITNFNISIDNSETIELPLFYYKGYSGYINEKKIPVSESENGLIELSVNQSGNVKVLYEGTFIQKISLYITLISIVLLSIYIIYTNQSKNKKLYKTKI